MKSLAVYASGGISKASNAGAVLTKRILLQRRRLDPLRLSAPPVRIPHETFQRIGIVFLGLTSERLHQIVDALY